MGKVAGVGLPQLVRGEAHAGGPFAYRRFADRYDLRRVVASHGWHLGTCCHQCPPGTFREERVGPSPNVLVAAHQLVIADLFCLSAFGIPKVQPICATTISIDRHEMCISTRPFDANTDRAAAPLISVDPALYVT